MSRFQYIPQKFERVIDSSVIARVIENGNFYQRTTTQQGEQKHRVHKQQLTMKTHSKASKLPFTTLDQQLYKARDDIRQEILRFPENQVLGASSFYSSSVGYWVATRKYLHWRLELCVDLPYQCWFDFAKVDLPLSEIEAYANKRWTHYKWVTPMRQEGTEYKGIWLIGLWAIFAFQNNGLSEIAS